MKPGFNTRRQTLREQFRSTRRALTQGRSEAEFRIQAAALEAIGPAQTIALYRAFDGEVSTDTLHAALKAKGARVVFSRMSREKGLRFIAADSWREGRSGLPVPQGPEVELEVGDVIVAPLVAFDLAGNRLGMGGGCYDRALSGCLARSIGLAFERQRVERLAVLDTDRPLDAVCTEQKTYDFSELEQSS